MRGLRGRAGRLAVAWLVAPGIVGLPAAARASGAPELRTNIELAEEAIRGAVGDAFRTLPRPEGPVRVVPIGTSDVNTLVESVLVEELSTRGMLVEVAAPSEAAALDAQIDATEPAAAPRGGAAGDAPAAPAEGEADAGGAPADRASADVSEHASGADVGEARLFFRVTDFSFRYADIYRRMLVGPKRIRRLAKTELHFRLAHAGSRSVAWSENTSHSAADVIPYGKADLLESKTYAFAKPERASGTLARLYEPLIVTGIVGGLVFLFYSNQSGD